MSSQPDDTMLSRDLIPIPTYYINAVNATAQSLAKSKRPDVRVYAKDCHPIDLTPNAHRALTALWGVYHEHGYTQATFEHGVSVKPYELCRRMWYAADSKGRVGLKAVEEAKAAVQKLAEQMFTIYFVYFKRREQGKNLYDVTIEPNCHLLKIRFDLSDVTEEEWRNSRWDNTKPIHVRIQPFFYGQNYYRLFESQFYLRLKALLKPEQRRVTKYHWNFVMWYLQQQHHREPLEINVDKLALTLKIPSDATHVSRARSIVRQLYADFTRLGYVQDYQVDVPAKFGGTKDILTLRGNWVAKRG